MQILRTSVCLGALVVGMAAISPAARADLTGGEVRLDEPGSEIAEVLIRSGERYASIAAETSDRIWGVARRTISDMMAMSQEGARPRAIADRARAGVERIGAVADHGVALIRDQRQRTVHKLRELEAGERAFEADLDRAHRAIRSIREAQQEATDRVRGALAMLTGG